MVSKKEILHLAKLARLELSQEEVAAMQKDLSSILDYFTVLQKAKKTKQGEHVSGEHNVLRKDLAEPKRGLTDDIMRQVKEVKDGYIKVKNIL